MSTNGTSEYSSEAVDSLIKKFSKIKLNNMDVLTEQVKKLQEQLETVKLHVEDLDRTPKVEEYKEISVNLTSVNDISLEMFKSLPEFNGERSKYSAWRNSALNVMKIFDGHTDKPKFFEALNIVRNKITGPASETLTNYNTVFNFDAMISRLDFTYADKRPIYLIEQEMIVLQQRNLSIEDFYDEVNKKLNALINKINMTYKEKNIARAMVANAAEKALRTFVTGLRGNLGQILYASNPTTLPEAYAKIQTIANDQERIRFANQFNQPSSNKSDGSRINPAFKPKIVKPFQQQFNRPFNAVQRQFDKPEPMDIDKSSMEVNIGKNDKRPRSGQYSNSFNNQMKVRRINMINGSTESGEISDEPLIKPDEIENEVNDGAESTCETASVFLGE